jgi:hypothetical protein
MLESLEERKWRGEGREKRLVSLTCRSRVMNKI